MTETKAVRRRSGVALWRQISDRIRTSIMEGAYDATGMVPAETVLARQFGVNRHTVRSALGALQQEGLVRAIQGRGTLIERSRRISFPISKRTRFTEGVGRQARDIEGLLLSSRAEAATGEVARALDLETGEPVLRLETLRKADRRPLSVSTSWFPLPRFAGMAEAYGRTGSITAAFEACGLPDYTRHSTEIGALHAEPEDVSLLALSPGAIVLVTRALNVDGEGKPVQLTAARFPADRVQFTVISD